MKAKLEFDLNDYESNDREEFKHAVNGHKYRMVLDEVWQQCFRPNYKHGYRDEALNTEEAHEIIDKLAEIYKQLLEDSEVDLW